LNLPPTSGLPGPVPIATYNFAAGTKSLLESSPFDENVAGGSINATIMHENT